MRALLAAKSGLTIGRIPSRLSARDAARDRAGPAFSVILFRELAVLAEDTGKRILELLNGGDFIGGESGVIMARIFAGGLLVFLDLPRVPRPR